MVQRAFVPTCKCGIQTSIKTSWTENNPGRKFFGCRMYGEMGACDFFQWIDPPLEERLRLVIVGLLRKTQRLEQEVGISMVDKKKKKDRKWHWKLWCLFIVAVLVLLLAIK